MKSNFYTRSSIIFLFLVGLYPIGYSFADTPPPGTVKAKMYSGDGVNAVTVTGGGSIDVNVTGGSGLTTSVNQGNAGSQAWLVDGSAHTQPVSGTFWQATQPVSGTLTCNAGSGTLAVSGPLTDTELRATAVPVSGTFFQATQPVSGPLTDAQLRASAVPVTGTITATNAANGNTGSAVPVQATQVGGSDGTNLRAVKVSSTGVVSVDGSASVQPISAASLPLPAGAATSALQSTINTTLGSPFQASGVIGNTAFGISGTLPAYAATPTFNLGTLNGAATAANQATIITNLGSPFQAGGSIGNSSFGISGTLPAYAATPTFNLGTLNGAATAANQATEIADLATIATNTTNAGTPVVSGTVTVTQATGTNLHAVVDSSALPTGAATSALQTTINTTLGSPMQNSGGSVTANLGTLNGAATTTLQTTGNASVASIDTKTPALGQALAAASVPVVLTAAQVTTLTPLTSVAVTQGTAANLNATVTGTVALGAGSAVIGHVIADSGSTTAVTSLPALPAGTNVIGHVIADSGSTTAVTALPATPAGTNLIGKVGIDQTTPGTTNLVALAANQSVNTAQINGVTPLMGNGVTGTGSQRVTIASDNTAFSVNASPIAGATDSQTTGTVSTVITLTAPSNAQGFILQNLQTSTANVRYAMGATATTTLGMQLAPGQDSGFVPTSANVTIVSESGTQNYNVQWVAK